MLVRMWHALVNFFLRRRYTIILKSGVRIHLTRGTRITRVGQSKENITLRMLDADMSEWLRGANRLLVFEDGKRRIVRVNCSDIAAVDMR